MGLFQAPAGLAAPVGLTDQERAERIGAILHRPHLRRAMAQGQGNVPPQFKEKTHMKATVLCVILVLAALSSGGCATAFYGNPVVPNGPAGCRAVCAQWDMELAGMVQMGEYSNGCICQVKGKTVTSSAAGAAIPAITGVVLQMRRAAEQNATVNRSTGAH